MKAISPKFTQPVCDLKVKVSDTYYEDSVRKTINLNKLRNNITEKKQMWLWGAMVKS